MKTKCLFLLILCLMLAALMAPAAAITTPASGDETEPPVCLPIIMYHEIKYRKLGKDAISPWEFESDLKYLKNNGYTAITIDDLLDYYDNGAPLPEKPVMLTFDDGYLSTRHFALPLLEQYDMKIVLSLIVKDTDDFSDTPDNNLDYAHLTWDQLNHMLDSGRVEVQNHAYKLHRITKNRYGCGLKKGESLSQYEAVVTEDLQKAQERITTMTGRTPAAFAYPYGRYNDALDAILRKLGFRATLSCRYGVNLLTRTEPDRLFGLKRLCRAHKEPVGRLLDKAYLTIK